MKQALIDTNIYSNALKGEKGAVALLRELRRIEISTISIGALLSGFKGGPVSSDI
jgi:hypothetical protein